MLHNCDDGMEGLLVCVGGLSSAGGLICCFCPPFPHPAAHARPPADPAHHQQLHVQVCGRQEVSTRSLSPSSLPWAPLPSEAWTDATRVAPLTMLTQCYHINPVVTPPAC